MSYNRSQQDKAKKQIKARKSHGNIMRKGGPHVISNKSVRHSTHQELHKLVVDYGSDE